MTNETFKNNLKAIVIIFFVITGATGLIYQIVWFKYLALFLGNTTYAQMIVLSAFLGGLAIGNYYFGKKADVLSNPLRFYAFFELTIGIYCLLYPTLNFFLGDAFIGIASNFNLDGGNFIFNLARLVLSSLLLFIPTIAMGGTLPVLSKFYIKGVSNTRKDLAVLYFFNSFGAVWGIVFGGFQLIKFVGLNATIYSAALVNLLIGIGALLLSKYSVQSSAEIEEMKQSSESSQKPSFINSAALRSIVLVAGISGLAALLYEMVWTRLFINIFGSSTYAFSIMLLVFISGITLGSLLISQKFFEKFDKFKLVSLFQSMIALSTMAVLMLYERLPYFLWKTSSLFVKSDSTFSIFLTLEFLICFAILFIPTIFMGMTLPLIASVVAEHNKKIGFSVGKVFAVNTVGTVLGVLLTGMIFLPLFGIKGSFEIGIAFNVIAAILIIITYSGFTKLKRIQYTSALGGILIIYILFGPAWNVSLSLNGVFKSLHQSPPATFEEYVQTRGNFDLLYYKEGINANVAVTESKTGPKQKVLIINGKPDASSITDMPTQILLGQIPMLLHPDAKNVFVVGFGSGVTIGTTLLHSVEKIDCAEISSEVIEAGKFFEKENHNCMSDDRLSIYNEDALTLLKLSNKNYDVIISEPSNPWIAGIGNLFSQEYFELCKSKLDTNGIMVQWFHLYESEDDIVKLVLSTFRSVFPNAQVWNGVANDIILVGYKNNFSPDYKSIADKMNVPQVKNEMAKIGISNLFTFLTCQSLSDRGVYLLSDDNQINSELHPLLEFYAPESFYIGETSMLIYMHDEKFDTLDNNLYAYEYSKQNFPGIDELRNAAGYHSSVTKNFRFTFGITKYLIDNNAGDYDTQLLYTKVYSDLQIDNPQKYHYEKMLLQYPDSISLVRDYLNLKILEEVNATNFLNIFSLEELSERYIGTLEDKPDKTAKLYIQLARNYLLNSELEKANSLCRKVAELIKEFPDIVYSIPMDEFYYTYAMVGHYMDMPEITFENYLGLININSSYEKLWVLRRMVAWKLNLNVEENINIGLD